MNNLTGTQNDIIANLTNEFMSLNNQPQSPSNSLDIGSLLQELSNDKKRRKEILIQNEAYLLKLKETIKNYARQLNDLLNGANICVWVKIYNEINHQIKIGTLQQRNNEHTWNDVLSVRVNQNSKTTYFNSKIAYVDEYTSTSTMSFYVSGNYQIKDIDTIEDLIKNEHFISKLKSLIIMANS